MPSKQMKGYLLEVALKAGWPPLSTNLAFCWPKWARGGDGEDTGGREVLAGKAGLEGHGKALDGLALLGQEGLGGREIQAHWMLPEDALPWCDWLTTEDAGREGGQECEHLTCSFGKCLSEHPVPLPPPTDKPSGPQGLPDSEPQSL